MRAPYRQVLAACAAAAIALLALAASATAASMLYIRGGGYGHGIGMSQYGAYGYALHGKSYAWILRHYYRGTELGTTDPKQPVRVLLSSGAAAFSGATRAGGKKLNAGTTYTVRANADGTLTLLDQHAKKVGTFAAPLKATGPGPLSLASVGTYRGSLEFRPDGGGGVETVNVVGLDDYVRGVIAAEMPANWSTAALEAQAVAARTYAITTDSGGAVFGLYSDTRSQMYGGVGAETPSTDAAVAATNGKIVTYDGVPAVTYFFSSSGGYTESIENVWPGASPEPWLRGVPDRYDGAGGDPYHRWSYAMSLQSAQSKLGGWVKGSLEGIVVTEHGVSPRIVAASVVGSKGTRSVTGSQLQQAFGLPSTYASFTVLSTAAGRQVQTTRRAVGERAAAQSKAVVALVPLVDNLVGSIDGLHGSILPAHKGARIEVQRSTAHGWRTVLRARLGAGGSYDTAVPQAGTYRVVYDGMFGPAVTVG